MARRGLGLGQPPAHRAEVVLLRRTDMDHPTKEEIIHRAYELWEQAGKPEGRDDEFYHQAERELRDKDKPSPEPDIL